MSQRYLPVNQNTLPIAALLLGAAFLFVAGGINSLILPVRGTSEGMSTFWLGLLGTGWAVGYVAGCLRVPHLVARVGHIRAFGVMSAIASLAILGSVLLVYAPIWVLFRAFAGFAFAGAAMIVESWLAERSDASSRGRVFGLYSMIMLGASTVGQLSLSLGPVDGAMFFVIAAMFYSLSLIPTAISSSHAPQPLLQVRFDVRGLWKNSPLAVVGVFLIGISNAGFGTLGPVYASELELPLSTITLFVSMPVLAGALAQIPIGWLSDRVDRRVALAVVAITAMLTDLAFVFMPPQSPTLVVGMAAVFGATVYTMYPILVAHANDHGTPGAALMISSALLMVFGIGSMAGPALAGLLMNTAGPRGLFLSTLCAHALLVGYIAWRMTRRSAVVAADKEPFHALAITGGATPQTTAYRVADDAALAEEGVGPVDKEPEISGRGADDRS